ncbi:MAG: hypothetical protein EOP08_14880, partial [Proteobacteria bacterium]
MACPLRDHGDHPAGDPMNRPRRLSLLALALGCGPLAALTACSGDEDLVVTPPDTRSAIEQRTGVNWFIDMDPVAKTPRTAIPTGNPDPIVGEKDSYTAAAVRFLRDNPETFGVRVEELVHRQTRRGQDGIWRVKFTQRVGNVDLVGASITLSIDSSGSIETFHGPFYPTFQSVGAQKATISPQAAMNKAAEKIVQEKLVNASPTDATLVGVVDPRSKAPVLVYR